VDSVRWTRRKKSQQQFRGSFQATGLFESLHHAVSGLGVGERSRHRQSQPWACLLLGSQTEAVNRWKPREKSTGATAPEGGDKS